jgi:hypothetical protein
MYAVLSGLITALSLVAATSFLRSYGRTRDRFLAIFALAFAIFGLTQFYLGVSNAPELNRPLAYLPRLVVFLLILGAILDKNRVARRTTRESETLRDLEARRRRRAAP